VRNRNSRIAGYSPGRRQGLLSVADPRRRVFCRIHFGFGGSSQSSGSRSPIRRALIRSCQGVPCPLHSEIATDRQPVAPTLPTAELAGSRRLPEHAREPTREWAQEESLTASKVARTRDQGYPLNESTHRDLKPSMARVSHVGADHTSVYRKPHPS